jgi:hypothetical protein
MPTARCPLPNAHALEWLDVVKAKSKPKHGARNRMKRRAKTAAIWVAVLGAIGGIFYGLANPSGIAYNDRQLTAIDFTSLNDDQKHAALVEANASRCGCGCDMTLAQCVATDMTCPIRTENITKIRAMVQKALHSGGSS